MGQWRFGMCAIQNIVSVEFMAMYTLQLQDGRSPGVAIVSVKIAYYLLTYL